VESEEIPIQCITVHKSKGLEYGHVILPFCYLDMAQMKQDKLQVSVEREDDELRIGYCFRLDETRLQRNDMYNETTEKDEKLREEARILYLAMTRAIRSFSWICVRNCRKSRAWQNIISAEV